MRRIFIIPVFLALLIISESVFSQFAFTNRIWVGQNNEHLQADSTIIRFETFSKRFGNSRVSKFYSLHGDTLKLNEANTDESGLTSEFLVKFYGSKKMSLIPVNSSAKLLTNLITLTGTKDTLNYSEVHEFPFDSLKFEKIVFISTECFGKCPVMSLELNEKKQFRFIGEKNTFAQGYFHGEISNVQYQALLDILRYSQLDFVECNKDKNIDLSTFSIEILYNGRSRNFKSCMLPFVLDHLKEFLIDLPAEISLVKSPEKFNINIDSVLK